MYKPFGNFFWHRVADGAAFRGVCQFHTDDPVKSKKQLYKIICVWLRDGTRFTWRKIDNWRSRWTGFTELFQRERKRYNIAIIKLQHSQTYFCFIFRQNLYLPDILTPKHSVQPIEVSILFYRYTDSPEHRLFAYT